MATRTLVERTIYVAQCPECDFRDIKDNNPPREVLCMNCMIWIKYEKESWTGQDKWEK